MSRSGYTDSCEGWDLIRWRGAVASAIRGKNGQAFLREMLQALDALPGKRLIAEELEKDGEVCVLGSLGLKRGIDMGALDPTEYDAIAETFGVNTKLVQEIEYENDEGGWNETPEQRFKRIRKWVVKHIREAKAADGGSQREGT